MRALLKMELIGEAIPEHQRDRYRGYKGGNKSRSWVARLTGLSDEYGFEREFLRGQRDYSKANSVGSRGIWAYYLLEPGLYEVNQRKTWRTVDRYFIRVLNDGTYVRTDRGVVMRCLASATLE